MSGMGKRLEKLESIEGQEAQILYCATDAVAMEAREEARRDGRSIPLCLVSDDLEHDPPLPAETVREMFRRVATHGQMIHSAAHEPISPWRLFRPAARPSLGAAP